MPHIFLPHYTCRQTKFKTLTCPSFFLRLFLRILRLLGEISREAAAAEAAGAIGITTPNNK